MKEIGWLVPVADTNTASPFSESNNVKGKYSQVLLPLEKIFAV